MKEKTETSDADNQLYKTKKTEYIEKKMIIMKWKI